MAEVTPTEGCGRTSCSSGFVGTARETEGLRPAGDVCARIEQESSIHLKAVALHGDPVELTAIEAREIATALLEAARKLETLRK